MSLPDWTRWSRPEAEPFEWLCDWVHAHPETSAALLACDDDRPGVGRLLLLQAHGQPEAAICIAPWLAERAPEVRMPLSLVESGQIAPKPRSDERPAWLPRQGVCWQAWPLVHQGRVAWWLLLTGTAEQLACVDLAELNLRAALGLGSALQRHMADRLGHGMAAVEALAEVQRALQPDRPEIRGLDYALHWQPAETAAGDYYDLMPLSSQLMPTEAQGPTDAWGVMVGDVSGHGAAAAMEAVQFDAILRTYKPDADRGPAGALSYANRHFLSRRSRQRLMTVLAAGYRPDMGLLRYANAGHLPLLLRRGGQVVRLAEGGMPLGVLRETEYQNHELQVGAGDLLLALTDGVIEARNRRGEPFGLERLERILASAPARPEALLQAILAQLFAHQGGSVGNDDQTLVVLQLQR
ncbi:MAG: PP2C family protein-serine/threonine phosphatase [Lysobacterales bacterium]